MLGKVTAYFGKLLRPSKPALSTPRVRPEISTRIVRVTAEQPLKRVEVDHRQKYTSRKATGNFKPEVRAIHKKVPKMDVNGSMSKTTSDNIIWMDLEMTGLDVDKEVIMEIGCIITDSNLNELARHPEIVLHVPDNLLNSMTSWCVATHGASGLTEACRSSTTTLAQAEAKLVEFMRQHTEPAMCPLGGNSNFSDRQFLKKYMPQVANHVHYRTIDVSTIKELVRRWYPKEYADMPKKRFIHKTVADLEDSIAELKYYRSVIFKSTGEDELTKAESKIKIK